MGLQQFPVILAVFIVSAYAGCLLVLVCSSYVVCRVGLRGEPAGQLPGVSTYKGHSVHVISPLL